MRSLYLYTSALLLTVAAHSASALTVDDRSMNNSDGSSRFSDPDDQSPLPITSESANHYSGDGGSRNGSTDPSGIRYDYDASSGSYIPHHQ